MPILDVEVVGPVPEQLQPDLARRIADAAGAALESPPQGTWVKLRCLDARAYAENAGGPPPGVRPILVSVLQAALPEPARLSQQASRLAAVIAEACDRPTENVHIVFEPPAAGRIAFGGTLRT